MGDYLKFITLAFLIVGVVLVYYKPTLEIKKGFIILWYNKYYKEYKKVIRKAVLLRDKYKINE